MFVSALHCLSVPFERHHIPKFLKLISAFKRMYLEVVSIIIQVVSIRMYLLHIKKNSCNFLVKKMDDISFSG